MRGKKKGWGKESMIAVTDGRAEVRKQAGMSVTPPDSYEANSVYSQDGRDTERKDEFRNLQL